MIFLPYPSPHLHTFFPLKRCLSDRSGRGRGGQLPDADAQAGRTAAPTVLLLRRQQDARVGSLPQIQYR